MFQLYIVFHAGSPVANIFCPREIVTLYSESETIQYPSDMLWSRKMLSDDSNYIRGTDELRSIYHNNWRRSLKYTEDLLNNSTTAVNSTWDLLNNSTPTLNSMLDMMNNSTPAVNSTWDMLSNSTPTVRPRRDTRNNPSSELVIMYDPPPNTVVPFNTVLNAVVKVVDNTGSALQTCEFFTIVKRKFL